jgi:hypothetical protein
MDFTTENLIYNTLASSMGSNLDHVYNLIVDFCRSRYLMVISIETMKFGDKHANIPRVSFYRHPRLLDCDDLREQIYQHADNSGINVSIAAIHLVPSLVDYKDIKELTHRDFPLTGIDARIIMDLDTKRCLPGHGLKLKTMKIDAYVTFLSHGGKNNPFLHPIKNENGLAYDKNGTRIVTHQQICFAHS